ncbi:RNA polymerase sigma factor [Aliikangiella sp. G2MR2-5]|uniref:RNA polymerase sigma factor n=1 Tax=Aliikangiella sp. G2MR2-5 TaxID=2788943 RepID=UPI0018AA2886|nr:sigma-70 family RNA polymerase sigma factor [Aliikangiella sp. G2MR2-5]
MPATKELESQGEVEIWVEQAVNGDVAAFERLYRSTSARLMMFIFRMIGDRQLAEEVLQESYIKAWQSIASFRQQSQFYTWLRKIASNLAIDRMRLKSEKVWQNSVELGNDEADAGWLSHAGAVSSSNQEHQMDLNKLIMMLPEGARNILVMHDIEGLAHKEISTMLNIAEGTSKAQLARARMLLRKSYLAS